MQACRTSKYVDDEICPFPAKTFPLDIPLLYYEETSRTWNGKMTTCLYLCCRIVLSLNLVIDVTEILG